MRLLAGIVLSGLASMSCARHQEIDKTESSENEAKPAAEEILTAFHRPVFTPDGRHVVFMMQNAATGGDWELFIANEDGSGAKRLTSHLGWDGYASFSPDGTRITFDRDDGENTNKRPMLMNLASGETRPLGDFEGWLSVNSWAPNGDTLFAFWEKGGQRDLYEITADGAVLTRITDTPDMSEHDAAIMPDGRSLLFAVEKVDGASRIDRIDLATGDRETLITSTGRVYGLAISPDGGELAYTDDTPGGDDDDAEIYILDLETGETRQMTDNEAWDHMPVFHPHGDEIFFTSYRSGNEKIYRMDLSGGSAREFTLTD